MYVCYVDESGTPDIPGNTSHFVLAGLAIPISEWKTFDESIYNIRKEYGLEDAEFHTAWILRAYREQSTIPNFATMSRIARRAAVSQERTKELLRLQKGRSKNYKTVKKFYKHTEDYIHLSLDERKTLVSSVATCIGSWQDARLFAECIDKTHFDPVGADATVGEQAFEQVVSRFEQFLIKVPGTKAHGILVHDNNETVAKRHTALMREFHQKGTLWIDIKRIIDTPLFVNSSLTSMVQMADLCSYALRRYFENGEKGLFAKIFKRAHRINNNKVVGVRHYAGNCRCIACAAHRGSPRAAKKGAKYSPIESAGK
jgi:hypothetical protein